MASQERRYVSPSKPGTSADPAWLRRQQRFFTAYVNSKLNKRDESVNDLFEDLKDGRVLKAFVEELSGTTIAGRQTSGTTMIQHVANLTPTFAFIKSTTKIVGIGPQDVADGNPGLVEAVQEGGGCGFVDGDGGLARVDRGWFKRVWHHPRRHRQRWRTIYQARM